MQTLSFEDGGTATLRDPQQVPVKTRRVWEHATMGFGTIAFDIKNRIVDEKEQEAEFTKAGLQNPEMMEAINDAEILALVSEWSYGPVSQDTLENLPSGTYNDLSKVCSPLAKQLSPNFVMETDPKADVPSGTPTGLVSVDSASAGAPTPIVPSITTLPTSL